MSEYTIRPLTIADEQQGAALWSLVFGDEEPVVREFYRLFSESPSFGLGAFLDGQLAAAAYAPDGADLITDGEKKTGVYLYAVATHPDHRKFGLARRLCAALRDRAFAQGNVYLFTKPAEDSLYPWYQEKIGAQPVLGCRSLQLRAASGRYPRAEKLSAEDYGRLRRELLAGKSHVELSGQWLIWESILHEAYGGGFYRVGKSVADVYLDEESLAVQEVLPASRAEDVCHALMATFGKGSCTCRGMGREEHYVSAVAADGALPEDNPWYGPIFG